jgi:hypothetical protein
MSTFDAILEKLHADGTGAKLTDDEYNSPITISPKRQFIVPEGYNTTLAYAGDVNSQLVTFKLPLKHEDHNLSLCTYKKLLWKNTTSGAEGVSDLINPQTKENEWICSWEVPPEAMAQAGALEIAISVYDFSTNGKLAFSWNTPTYPGFTIGNSFTHVGIESQEEKLPAKNEILNIDIESRYIIVPPGYNTTICNFGDIGTSKLYFAVEKNVRGIDVTSQNTKVFVNVSIEDSITDEEEISKEAIKLFTENGNKVLMSWDIPPNITNNSYNYVGPINISLKFIEYNGDEIVKRWVTTSFTQLLIGTSLLLNDIADINERDEEIIEKVVKQVVEEVVEEEVDDYFDEHYFITES